MPDLDCEPAAPLARGTERLLPLFYGRLAFTSLPRSERAMARIILDPLRTCGSPNSYSSRSVIAQLRAQRRHLHIFTDSEHTEAGMELTAQQPQRSRPRSGPRCTPPAYRWGCHVSAHGSTAPFIHIRFSGAGSRTQYEPLSIFRVAVGDRRAVHLVAAAAAGVRRLERLEPRRHRGIDVLRRVREGRRGEQQEDEEAHYHRIPMSVPLRDTSSILAHARTAQRASRRTATNAAFQPASQSLDLRHAGEVTRADPVGE